MGFPPIPDTNVTQKYEFIYDLHLVGLWCYLPSPTVSGTEIYKAQVTRGRVERVGEELSPKNCDVTTFCVSMFRGFFGYSFKVEKGSLSFMFLSRYNIQT